MTFGKKNKKINSPLLLIALITGIIICAAFWSNSEPVISSNGLQCSDGLDNDFDGKTDYPDDPGCASATDPEEFNSPAPPAPVNGLVAGGLLWYPVPALGQNLLNNPGFEQVGTNGRPTSWEQSGGTWGDPGWTVDNTVAHTNTNSLRIRNANLTPFSDSYGQALSLKKGSYRISGWIKMQDLAATSGNGIRLCVAYMTAAGGRCTQIIKGTSDWQYLEGKNIVITQDISSNFQIGMHGEPNGTAWIDDVELREELQSPVDVFMLYPNYRGYLFDDQTQIMRFDITVNPPSGTQLSDYRIEATITDESNNSTVLTQTFSATSNFVASINGVSLANGKTYLARFKLVRLSDNTALYEYPAYRVSKVSGSVRSSMTISFDENNRTLFKGQPKFLLGVYDSGLGYTNSETSWENTLFSATGERRMGDLPINFYLNYWYGSAPNTSILALMNVLQRHGIYNLTNANCFASNVYGSGWFLSSSDSVIAERGAHPSFGGFYTLDECIPEIAPNVFGLYQRIKALDPDGITFGCSNQPNSLSYWRDAVDLLSIDAYPIVGATPPAGGYPLNEAADFTKATYEAVKKSRAVATVLQFFSHWSGPWPTQDQLRNMSYLAIAEGTNGLFYWSIGANALAYSCDGSTPEKSPSGSASWCPFRVQQLENLKAVVQELNSLQPALSSLDRPDLLAGNSNSSIHTRVKFANNKGYLIASNYTNANQTATFTWATTPTSVFVYNEGRTLPLQSPSFTDTFTPYQAHVYEIDTTGAPPPPIDTIAPSVPTGLSATAISSTQINLSWTASTDNVGVTGYKVYRSGTQIAIVTSGTSYSDTGLSPSTSYSYTVSAYDTAGNNSNQSSPVSATTLATGDTTPPILSAGSPSGILASGTSQTNISLTTNEAATCRYSLIANTAYSSMTNTFSTTGSTNHSTNVSGLQNGRTYTYYVRCQDSASNVNTSDFTISFSIALPSADTTPPSVPANLRATVISSSQINLSWTASTDNVGVVGYKVYRSGTQIATVTSGTTYSNTGLSPSTTYSYTVSAYDTAGNNSNQSSPVTAATSTLTTGPTISLTPTSFEFSAVSGAVAPSVKTLTISNTGNASLSWAATTNFNWCRVFPASGNISPNNSQNITVSVDAPSNTGAFSCIITISGSGATNTPQKANLTYTVSAPSTPTPTPTPTPSPTVPTLSVQLSASPSSGPVILTTNLTANVSGTASGYITYTFYCHRPDSGTNIIGPYDARYSGQTSLSKTHTCNYSKEGTFTAKVIAERGTAPYAEARTTITVSGPGEIPPEIPPSPEDIFTQNLSYGFRGEQVLKLQQFLNVYPQTGFFGPLTQSAVRSFQLQHNLSTSGILDSSTRAKLNELYEEEEQEEEQEQVITFKFNLNLRYGMRNDDIKKLQEFLAQDKNIYPEAKVTGYFGPLTLRAVQRFQLKYNIAGPGILGYGMAGPKTRAKLNELYSSEEITTPTTPSLEAYLSVIQQLMEQIKILQEKIKTLQGAGQ